MKSAGLATGTGAQLFITLKDTEGLLTRGWGSAAGAAICLFFLDIETSGRTLFIEDGIICLFLAEKGENQYKNRNNDHNRHKQSSGER